MTDRADQDQRLVRSTLEGREEAFAELVARYQKMVTSVAWRYGVRRDDIEDLVSEVFFKVYRNLHQYRPAHAFSTWLYRLAANHVLDHGRRMRREAGRSELPDQIVDDRPDAGEQITRRERSELVREALHELPLHYRAVLFLVYVEGRRVDETARTLGLPTGTVKSRLKRGRDALRRVLTRRHPEQFGEV